MSQDETYPHFLDRQASLVNADVVGIQQWSAVKVVSGQAKVMTTADVASQFYGVALEPIPPGKTGRVLRSGLLSSSQLAGAPTITEGGTIYHSESTAGAFATSGTRVFGTGAANGFCHFKGA